MIDTRKHKVFQLLAGGPWGGGGVVVLALSKRLMQEGCSVWVLSLSDEVSKRFSETGVKVVSSHFWRRDINPLDLLVFFELFYLFKRGGFDVVHTHTSKGGFLGRIAARLAGVPLVIHTVHGFAFHEFTNPLARLFYIRLEKIAARFCDLIICVNHEDRLTAIEEGIVDPEKIVTIVNGIDLSQFDIEIDVESQKEILGLPKEAILVGTVGRLAPQKGYKYLIEASPEILRFHPNVWFLYVGDGPLRFELERLAGDLGVGDHCLGLGFRKDIPQLLACFDILVLPSLREGLSITLLEAMAAGKAIVASNIKGNREVLIDGVNGLLCQAGNSEALVKSISTLINNPGKAYVLGKKARETVEKNFDERLMLDRTIEFYFRLMDHTVSHHGNLTSDTYIRETRS